MVSLLLAHYLQRLSELELETHLLGGGGGRCQVQSLCYKVKTMTMFIKGLLQIRLSKQGSKENRGWRDNSAF